jgi:hypothetical protein
MINVITRNNPTKVNPTNIKVNLTQANRHMIPQQLN